LQADDDVPALQQHLERAEHHRQADDDDPYRRSDNLVRARYDAAERALLDVLAKYRDIVDDFDIGFRNHRRLSGRGDHTYAVRHEPRSLDF
jgi:hypothetical protein